jgi:DNA (cytosine-5)-methyltransferase 1
MTTTAVSAFYNDNDPFVCAWLRELIAAKLIPSGVVSEASIHDLKHEDLRAFTHVHLFAGIGGWAYALRLAGWPDDVPVWTGSCPCQPFSVAGKGRGVNDPRHLWPVMRELIAKCSPPIVFGEQVASPAGREWLSGVRSEMEALGYAVGASDLCAASIGATHIRQRLYFVAHTNGERLEGLHKERGGVDLQSVTSVIRRNWVSEPTMDRVAHGIPGKMGRLRGFGNAIVPQIAAEFIQASVEAISSLDTQLPL